MAASITIDSSYANTIHGHTRSPDHTWRIEVGHSDHCRLHVDDIFVMHSDMWHCLLYLLSLTE